MNRTLLIAAVATLAAGTVAAQSSVTIYGRLNVTAEDQAIEGVKTKRLNDNASRLGFKGTEDLGGGLRANFILEHRFDASNGVANSTFWAGQSEVNLQGNFGTIRLGNFTSEAYFATADFISLHNHDTGLSADALYADTRGFGQTNKIGYATPNMGGLVVHASVNAGEGVEPDKTWELGAYYDLGALSLGAGYQKTGDANQFAVRALYTIGAFTVGGYAQRDEDTLIAGGGSRTNLRAIAMYAVGASEFHVNVGGAGDYSNVNDSAARQYTLGYNYNLSKRTKVYGYATKISADGNSYVPNLRSVALGVRHNF